MTAAAVQLDWQSVSLPGSEFRVCLRVDDAGAQRWAVGEAAEVTGGDANNKLELWHHTSGPLTSLCQTKRDHHTLLIDHVQVPNGELSAKQLRWLGGSIAKIEGGCGDITTRANIQLRGMTLEESDDIFRVRCLPKLASSESFLGVHEVE